MARIEWLLGSPKACCGIMLRLKDRVRGEELSPDASRWLVPAYERARAAWLMSRPGECELPPVSKEQIAAWIDDLAQAEPPPGAESIEPIHRRAEEELSDLLARQDTVAKVTEALQTRLAGGDLDTAAAERLQRLADLTRPAMVAEYWIGRRHRGVQHLLVGVPSLGPGAARPSHFDRIDDKTAHCVSGQNLSEGDYPVGVAIPHPNQRGALFHLVNLPTARRRLAYAYHLKTDEPKRLAELTRRTAEHWLGRRTRLSELELALLPGLDPREVSRLAGELVNTVEDERTPEQHVPMVPYQPGLPMPRVHPTRLVRRHHATICTVLAVEGTREAVPGLLKAIGADRFAPPDARAPERMEWIAALAIAGRDPWPEVDAWLAGLVERTELLVIGRPDAPELGATAAGLLLRRHGRTSGEFGLEPAEDRSVAAYRIEGYRFAGPASREKVRRWWERQQGEP
jgi:hypothetical protein